MDHASWMKIPDAHVFPLCRTRSPVWTRTAWGCVHIAPHVSIVAGRFNAGVTLVVLRVAHYVLSSSYLDCNLVPTLCMCNTDSKEKSEDEGVDEGLGIEDWKKLVPMTHPDMTWFLWQLYICWIFQNMVTRFVWKHSADRENFDVIRVRLRERVNLEWILNSMLVFETSVRQT